MMTYRERIMATLRSEPTDCLPFVPRLDLWYKSNKTKGTLPYKYRNATLMEICEDLDVGYHAIIPDFQNYNDPLDVSDRGLGIWRLNTIPYRAEPMDINRIVSQEGDVTTVEYLTPVGNIRTKVLYNDSMRQAGITLSHVLEHAIKKVEDYDVVGYIFEHLEILPNYEEFLKFKAEVGERGVAVGLANQGASPMHEIIHELMPYDLFFFETYDHPEELKKLSERMSGYFQKVFDVVADSPAEIIMLGSNYDTQITWPAFYEEHITPYLAAAADNLHARGKYLLTHTDGENKGLLSHYVASKFDIADSICPSPMTSLNLREMRESFASKITIWGGIPSISVLENSMNDYEFEKYINDIFGQIGAGDHIILSIADTTPPEAKFSRIELIAKLTKQFGPVKF